MTEASIGILWRAILVVVFLSSVANVAPSQTDNSVGGSAYSNGSAARSTPGISRFDPNRQRKSIPGSSISTNRTFGKPDNTFSPQESAGGLSSQGSVRDGRVSASTIEFVDEIDLPALEPGAIVEMNVREGDAVATGKEIAKIDAAILEFQLQQATIREENAERIANDRTSIEAAEKQIQLTKHIYETKSKLLRKGAASYEERMTAKYEYEVALLQRQASLERQLEARGEANLERARAQEVRERIRRHSVVPKFDGVVTKRYKQAGEWVTAGEPVIKIARMDKLYVTGLVSNRNYNPAEVMGKDVVVTVELARNETMEFRGKIVIIGKKDIAGSGNEFKVKAEITNRTMQGQWVLREDARVSMRMILE